MKKTPNAEQVYSNLRADNEEWHSPAPRLDACEGLAGKLKGSFVFRRCRCAPGNFFLDTSWKHGSVSGPFHPLFGSHSQTATLRQEIVRSRSKRLCSVYFWRCGVLVESGGVLVASKWNLVESLWNLVQSRWSPSRCGCCVCCGSHLVLSG